MLVKFGAIIASASGKQGGVVAASNRYGLYTRSWRKPVNPASASQVIVRAFMSEAAVLWAAMTDGEQQAWETYAAAIPWKNRQGDVVYLTGNSMFKSCYCGRKRLEMPGILTAPAVLALPDQDSGLSLACYAGDQKAMLSWTALKPWCSEPGSVLGYYLSIGQSPTTNFFKGPFKYQGRTIGATPTPPASPVKFTPNVTLTAGQKIWYRCRFSLADGRLSDVMDGFCTVQAGSSP
jgi:hypothetical protein